MVKAIVDIEETESGIKPEYVKKWRRIQKEKILRIGGIKNFRKRYGLK